MKGLNPLPLAKRQVFSVFVVQLLVIMFLVEFVKGALLITILPVYMSKVLQLSAFVIGLSMSLQYIGDNVFRSPIGWLIDKIGYRTCILIGVLLTFAAVMIISLTGHYAMIVFACAVLGVGTSPLWPSVITATTAEAGENARGTIMSVVYMAWLTGVGLGPVVINFFVGVTYNAAFRLLTILMLIVLVVAFFLPRSRHRAEGESPKHESAQGRLGRTMLLESQSVVDRVRQYFREVRKSIDVKWMFYPALFAQNFALGILTPILTLYAHTVLNLTPKQYSFLLIAGGAITVLCLIPVGKLVDKWGTAWFLHIGFVLSSMTLLLFTYVSTIPLVYSMVILLGIGYAFIIPSWNAYIAAVIPKEKRGAVWGFFLTIEGLGMIIGPVVSGKMWDTFGPHMPFLISGGVLALLFVLHLFISQPKQVVVR